MKRILALVAITIILAGTGDAQGSGFGLGVILGEPTGVSAKGWLSSRSAFDAGLAWSFRGEGNIHVHADYLWHFSDVVRTEQQVLPYLGIGGRLGDDRGSTVAGIRVPVGIAWLPAGAPIDVFMEVAPIMDLAPETDLALNGGLGVRFFFR